jgi:hypothetical protein
MYIYRTSLVPWQGKILTNDQVIYLSSDFKWTCQSAFFFQSTFVTERGPQRSQPPAHTLHLERLGRRRHLAVAAERGLAEILSLDPWLANSLWTKYCSFKRSTFAHNIDPQLCFSCNTPWGPYVYPLQFKCHKSLVRRTLSAEASGQSRGVKSVNYISWF